MSASRKHRWIMRCRGRQGSRTFGPWGNGPSTERRWRKIHERAARTGKYPDYLTGNFRGKESVYWSNTLEHIK